MLRNKGFSYRLGLSMATAIVLGAGMIGCSSGGGGDVSGSMPSGPAPVAKKPAMGPAIVDKLKFDQLALDSQVQKVSKGGVSYLVFKYTDMEGNVRTCELPEVRSKNDLTPGEWISTFNTYKKTESVVVKKREVRQTDQGVVDFPFVSPKPVRVQPSSQSSSSSQPPAPQGPSPIPSPSSSNGAPMPTP